jgi:hydrogenase maturation protease
MQKVAHTPGGPSHPPAEGVGSVLLIGYGNSSRRDDGVAEHILRRLLAALDLDPESLMTEQDEEQRPGLRAVLVHQLAPELAELAWRYDTVVFLDAHVPGVDWEPLAWQAIEPTVQGGMSGHHLKPGVILSLCETLYGHRPQAYMLSVLGHNFDFGETLTAETSKLADQAVQRLLELVAAGGAASRAGDA